MKNNFKKILILAPHADDGELGCGGTIVRFLKEKKKIFYVAFSLAEKSIPKNLPKNTTREEMKKAMKMLGIPEDNLIILNYETRNFPQDRQEILEEMIKLNRKIKPDLVLLPSSHDTHQDHQVISQEGFRAFKNTSILGYELPWNNLSFIAKGFVALKKEDIAKKVKVLDCYKSQSSRLYMSKKFAENLAGARGVQINTLYAEAFEVVRWII